MKRFQRKNIHHDKGTTLRGVVVSNKMQDTIVVAINRYVMLPKIRKYIKKTKRYSVHAPANTHKIGDPVSIQACRPISKTKSFIVL